MEPRLTDEDRRIWQGLADQGVSSLCRLSVKKVQKGVDGPTIRL